MSHLLRKKEIIFTRRSSSTSSCYFETAINILLTNKGLSTVDPTRYFRLIRRYQNRPNKEENSHWKYIHLLLHQTNCRLSCHTTLSLFPQYYCISRVYEVLPSLLIISRLSCLWPCLTNGSKSRLTNVQTFASLLMSKQAFFLSQILIQNLNEIQSKM